MFRRFLLSFVATVALAASFVYLPGSQAVAQQVQARQFDTNKYAELRKLVYSPSSFPRLRKVDFEIIDPTRGMKYNCIAHSLGIHSYWVNPQTGPAGRRLAPMDRMYTQKGYTRVSGLNFRHVPGLRKVVVYALVSGGKITAVTHAAVQEADGTWTSKLGQLPLIRHRTPNDLNGPS